MDWKNNEDHKKYEEREKTNDLSLDRFSKDK